MSSDLGALCDDAVSSRLCRFGAQWPKKWVAPLTLVLYLVGCSDPLRLLVDLSY